MLFTLYEAAFLKSSNPILGVWLVRPFVIGKSFGKPFGMDSLGELAPVVESWNDKLKQQLTVTTEPLTQEVQELILGEFDELAKTHKLILDKQLQVTRDNPTYVRETSSFGTKPKKWTDLEVRRANRILFHLLMPDVIGLPEPLGISRVLSYASRGSTQGEIGLVLNQKRSATCMAFAHQDAEGDATNVELVRISAELFQEIVDESPEVRSELQLLIKQRVGDNGVHYSRERLHSTSRRAWTPARPEIDAH